MVKIRLNRGGRIKRPFYTIVAADSRMPVKGRFLEKLGRYSPSSSEPLSGVKVEEIKAWVEKGAVVSSTVASLLKRNGIQLRS